MTTADRIHRNGGSVAEDSKVGRGGFVSFNVLIDGVKVDTIKLASGLIPSEAKDVAVLRYGYPSFIEVTRFVSDTLASVRRI